MKAVYMLLNNLSLQQEALDTNAGSSLSADVYAT